MPTPYHLLGNFYPRYCSPYQCPSFEACPLCSCCRNRDPYSAMCGACEKGKADSSGHLQQNLICNGPDCVDRGHALAALQKRIGKPLFDPSGDYSTEWNENVAENEVTDKIVKELAKTAPKIPIRDESLVDSREQATLTHSNRS
jgi:hypothetical protein